MFWVGLLASLIFGTHGASAREFLEPISDGLIGPHIKQGFVRLENPWGTPIDPTPVLSSVEELTSPPAQPCGLEISKPLRTVFAPELIVSTRRPVKGSILRVQVKAPKYPGAPSEIGKVFLGDQSIPLDRERETDQETIYEALIGIPYNDPAEDRGLCVKLGNMFKCTSLQVQPGHYRKTSVKVNREKMRPKSDEESALLKNAFAHPTLFRLWEKGFKLPVKDPAISGSYGKMRRYLDEKTGDLLLTRHHGGMDYLSVSGTPIHAPASGKIVLVAPLNAEGNAVFVDHGRGLYTMYFHLSRFAPELKAGDFVKQGQILGFTGNTGRVDKSGPGQGNHLHYGAEVWGVGVNPADLTHVISQEMKSDQDEIPRKKAKLRKSKPNSGTSLK